MTTLAEEISDLAVRAGAPDADLTILAEGNAAVLDKENDRFLVKASGVVMGEAKAEDWVWVSLSKSVEILEDAHKNGRSPRLDTALDVILKSAVTPNGVQKKASIETLLLPSIFCNPAGRFIHIPPQLLRWLQVHVQRSITAEQFFLMKALSADQFRSIFHTTNRVYLLDLVSIQVLLNIWTPTELHHAKLSWVTTACAHLVMEKKRR
jgi:hypothetical protein